MAARSDCMAAGLTAWERSAAPAAGRQNSPAASKARTSDDLECGD